MANIRIPCLIARSGKASGVSYYWQPSRFLSQHGWKPLALGKDRAAAMRAAEARNAEVAAWKSGLSSPSLLGEGDRPQGGGGVIPPLPQSGTLSALIARYRRDILHGRQPDGSPRIKPSTARTYNAGLKRLEKWAGKQPLAFITPARVRALREAMIAPASKGGVGHHAAHQTLKAGRQLFAFAESCDLLPRGSNPFLHFGLAAPAPRDVVWSPPAREAMLAAAHALHRPSLALAIMLGFAIGQRQADIIALSTANYRPLSEHMCLPEDYRALAARAPDGVPMALRLRQGKTRVWIEVPVTGAVRAAIEANMLRARALGTTQLILDDTRLRIYSGAEGQNRFQDDFALIRTAAAQAASEAGDHDLATELAALKFLDLRRTCVVYLGELGMNSQLIAGITGHDIDETERILKTYLPRTTGRAASAIALITLREEREAEKQQDKRA